MTETTMIPVHHVSWADLTARDTDAAHAFYGGLLGWTPDEANQEFGGYHMFRLGADTVAGVNPMQQEGMPAMWFAYVNVEDAAATVERVRAAGGQVMVEPMAVGSEGTMAVFVDPTGAALGIWEPGRMAGFGTHHAPHAVSWTELSTGDTAAAAAFYQSVFGWAAQKWQGDMPYTTFKVGDDDVAGMQPLQAGVPQAFWLSYISTPDVHQAAQRVTELGGRVTFGPQAAPGVGTFLTALDPNGAAFGLFQPEG